jgi:pyruvate/2-oxoglutarate dehydrogenase complex dihydrolipoamide dehydrogenase (E3) component
MPNIYAAGDICMNWKFTHAANAAARIVIKNTLFSPFGSERSKLSSLVMSWVTYTDPEIAHVGMYEHEAQMTSNTKKLLEFITVYDSQSLLIIESKIKYNCFYVRRSLK